MDCGVSESRVSRRAVSKQQLTCNQIHQPEAISWSYHSRPGLPSHLNSWSLFRHPTRVALPAGMFLFPYLSLVYSSTSTAVEQLQIISVSFVTTVFTHKLNENNVFIVVSLVFKSFSYWMEVFKKWKNNNNITVVQIKCRPINTNFLFITGFICLCILKLRVALSILFNTQLKRWVLMNC